jgi:hypothetical protein
MTRDNHGEPQGYGFLLTSSAITAICFQFWTMMRVIKMKPQFLMMAAGTLFYLVGFAMFGIVSVFWLFVLAVVIITIGEMIVMPTSQALATGFARMDMSGRWPPDLCWTITIPTFCGTSAQCYARWCRRWLWRRSMGEQ